MGSKTKQTTKKDETQRIQHDPQSLATFQALQSPILQTLLGYMQQPGQNTFEDIRVQQAQRPINTAFSGQMQNLTQALQQFGLAGQGSPFFASQAGKIGRARSGATAQNRLQNILASEQYRQFATQLGSQFRPLQVGQTAKGTSETVTQQSMGLGQILGAVLPMAAAFIPGMGGAGAAAGQVAGGGTAGFGGGLGMAGVPSQLQGLGGGLSAISRQPTNPLVNTNFGFGGR